MLHSIKTSSSKPSSDATSIKAPASDKPLKVLFVYPPVRLALPARVPPMGFLYMGAILEQAGIEVEIMDLNVDRMSIHTVMDELEKREFDVLGIGGMTTVYYYIKLFSLMAKERFPNIPIIGGGSACSSSPEIVLENTGVDVVCIGEGEAIIEDLVRSLTAGQSVGEINGIAYRNNMGEVVKTPEGTRFAGWPAGLFPAHHLVDMEVYLKNNQLKYGGVPGLDERIAELGIDPEQAARPVHIFSKRGCPFGCSFCYRNFGRKVVYDDVEHVLDYMAFLSETYHTKHFVFADELFNVNQKWVDKFCTQLKARGDKYILSTSNGLRANCCTEESLQQMYDVGFYRVGLGIESFYDPSLKAMQKGQDAATIKNAIRLIRKVGMRPSESLLLFGYETDGWEAMQANVEGLTELEYNSGFVIPCPYPGTFLYDKAIEAGLITDEEGWLMELSDRDVSSRVINLSGRPIEELDAIIQWGRDQLAINLLRKKYPIAMGVMDKAQPWVRQKTGGDLLTTLWQFKKKASHLKPSNLPKTISKTRSFLRDRGQKNGKTFATVELGQDGMNIVDEKGLDKFGNDLTIGDRYLLGEALTCLESGKYSQPPPLPFLQ